MPSITFGLNVSTSATPDADPVRDARMAEDLGFDFISSSDHPCGTEPTYETWTMLSWIAASTSRIGIATRVLGVPYRAPAMVAKMAETLARLSRGRLILGLGGGFSDDEFRAFGLGVRSPKEKTDGLQEAVTVIRGLWRERRFSFRGRMYEIDDAPLEPKPEVDIPIWLGTFAPRSLAVTGRLADGWIPSLAYAPPDEVVRMRRRVLDAALDAGRDPSEITCAYNVAIRVDGRPGDSSSSAVTGSPEAVAERLRSFTELGFSAINLMPQGPNVAEQVELLAHEVIPRVRA